MKTQSYFGSLKTYYESLGFRGPLIIDHSRVVVVGVSNGKLQRAARHHTHANDNGAPA